MKIERDVVVFFIVNIFASLRDTYYTHSVHKNKNLNSTQNVDIQRMDIIRIA